MAFPVLFGGLQPTLVAPGILRGLRLTRAQVSARATSLAGDGTTWLEYGADAARYYDTSQRLLIEGQRTNGIRNPRCEGAVVGVIGAGGALPTNWVWPSVTGLTREVVGFGVEDGIEYVDVRLSGTNTSGSTGFPSLAFEAALTNVAASGQVWTAAFFCRLIAGSLAGFTAVSAQVAEYSGGGSFLAGTGVAISPTSAALGSQRFASTRTFNQATTARSNALLASTVNNGASVEATLRVGRPQIEQGAFAATPILPPVGTPGASTRGADLVSATLASLGIGANGACTILWSGVLPNASPAAGSFTLCQIDDGTTNNRIFLRDNAGTNFLLWRVTGGAAANAAAGSYTPGAPFRFGITIDGAGRAACTFNGGSVVAVTGAPLAGLATLRLGGGISGSESMFGETREFIVIPGVLSDANLAARVAALPL